MTSYIMYDILKPSVI